MRAELTAEGPLWATDFRRIFGGVAAAECCKARTGCKRGAAMARATSNDDGGDRIISNVILPAAEDEISAVCLKMWGVQRTACL